MSGEKWTPGPWDWACDSYGKVRHSRKWCVSAVVNGEGGERIVSVASRIESSDDARLIAAAPSLLHALEELVVLTEREDVTGPVLEHLQKCRELIAAAEPKN
jgi:hypothetical protein